VGSDPVGAQEMVRQSGQRGVPVIVVDGQVVVGFDQARLELLLAAQPRQVALGAAVADAAKFAPNAVGAYVGQIHSGSPAERLGLRVGDIILRLAGRQVRTAADLELAITGQAPGARLAVEWLRDGLPMHGQAVL
jgi:S1-C subfamily serine protease